ncbi:MAG TPA: hypothetical protein VLM91_01735 [Candidatus Methylomirabilis sp.]|nr:hypothetical protein [Candidatus Methylomirabilis sp.]
MRERELGSTCRVCRNFRDRSPVSVQRQVDAGNWGIVLLTSHSNEQLELIASPATDRDSGKEVSRCDFRLR